MRECIIYAAGYAPTTGYCIQVLKQAGFTILSEPSDRVTHLLLPIPSFATDGSIVGGGNLSTLLTLLPRDIIVIGGNLDCPDLVDYSTIDLLDNPFYLIENAKITAYCALQLAASQLPVILDDCKVLVLGWGRIGKFLASLLQRIGAHVTICARKETDRCAIHALGFHASDFQNIDLSQYQLIFNTVPKMVFPKCPGTALKIDLASTLGLGAPDVIWARGLPGKYAPQSSGTLIAKTLISIL